MNTKIGDWIRLCHNGQTAFFTRPHFSRNKYKVIAITPEGHALVKGPFQTRGHARSWVRCEDMKEAAP